MVAVGSDVMGWSRLMRSVQMQRTHQMLGRDMKNAFVNKKKIFFYFGCVVVLTLLVAFHIM
jgi:hypothetical protein